MFRQSYVGEFAAYVLRSKEGWPEDEAGWDLLGLGLEPNHWEPLRSDEGFYYWALFWLPETYDEGYAGAFFVESDDMEYDEASTSDYAPVRCVKTEEGVNYYMMDPR